MTITLHLGTRGLIGFPSKSCRQWGIEINGRFVGFTAINEPIGWRGPHEPIDVSAR